MNESMECTSLSGMNAFLYEKRPAQNTLSKSCCFIWNGCFRIVLSIPNSPFPVMRYSLGTVTLYGTGLCIESVKGMLWNR